MTILIQFLKHVTGDTDDDCHRLPSEVLLFILGSFRLNVFLGPPSINGDR